MLKLKHSKENQIEDILTDYQVKTGLTVYSVHIRHEHYSYGNAPEDSIKVRIEGSF